MNTLEEARLGIRAVDKDIAALFEKRMRLVAQILEYKKERGLPILDAEQEARVVAAGAENVSDPALREYYVLFLQEVLRISRSYQARLTDGMKIACCGAPGSPAQVAASRAFPDATMLPYPDFAGAYRACESGEAEISILPVENTFADDLGTVMDKCFGGSLYINLMLCPGSVPEGEAGKAMRFAVFSRACNTTTQPETSGEHFILVFTVRDEAAALAKILNIIGSHGFNMSSLRSCPARGRLWNSYFFAELEGSVRTEEGSDLLRQLETVCDRLKLVGDYKSLKI